MKYRNLLLRFIYDIGNQDKIKGNYIVNRSEFDSAPRVIYIRDDNEVEIEFLHEQHVFVRIESLKKILYFMYEFDYDDKDQNAGNSNEYSLNIYYDIKENKFEEIPIMEDVPEEILNILQIVLDNYPGDQKDYNEYVETYL